MKEFHGKTGDGRLTTCERLDTPQICYFLGVHIGNAAWEEVIRYVQTRLQA